MAPPSKRSLSPTEPPSWLAEFITEQKRIVLQQNLAIRDLHLTTRENHQTLRELVSVCSNMAISNRSLQPIRMAPTNRRLSMAANNHPVPVPPINNKRQANGQLRAADAKILSARNQICWYHKQFGKASSSCVQPCQFEAPVLPAASSKPTMAVKHTVTTVNTSLEMVTQPTQPARHVKSIVRVPLERKSINVGEPQTGNLSDSSSSSSSSQSTVIHPSTKSGAAADWNEDDGESSSSDTSNSSISPKKD